MGVKLGLFWSGKNRLRKFENGVTNVIKGPKTEKIIQDKAGAHFQKFKLKK
jgi:hypothetical protein